MGEDVEALVAVMWQDVVVVGVAGVVGSLLLIVVPVIKLENATCVSVFAYCLHQVFCDKAS